MKVILMAGGRGTRISSAAPDIPKPMIRINHKPVLEWEIECLREQGFTDMIITVSHLSHVIMDYFGDGSRWNVHISYYIEEQPLGNAGAVFKLWQEDRLDSDFLLLIADAVFQADFHKFTAFHREKGALATIFTHPNSHPYDSALVIADEETSLVTGWIAKEETRPKYYRNRVNAGLHILSPDILALSGIRPDDIGVTRRADLDRDILMPMAASLGIYAYDSVEYVKDMGTPERLAQVRADFCSGRAQARSLRNKQRAIFLEADGIMREYTGADDGTCCCRLAEGAAQALRRINHSGWLAVITASQPETVCGTETAKSHAAMQKKLDTLLGDNGAFADAYYSGMPQRELFEKAARDHNICLEQSWMIGFSRKNMEAAVKAGYRAVRLQEEKNDGAKEFFLKAESLLKAAESVLAWPY